MSQASYKEALKVFANQSDEFIVEPVTNGLINQSFKITCNNTGGSFLLQQINHHVFTRPEKVQQNYMLLWKYLREKDIPFIIPEPKHFINDKTFFRDGQNNYWRVFEFISGTKTLNIADNISQAKGVANIFAGFTACFSKFDSNQLHITIPDFHNLSLRFRQFTQSLSNGLNERIRKSQQLIDDLNLRERYVNFYETIIESDEFRLRVMHHDAKISNVLFDTASEKLICPVDFDTVMPGYFFSDLGDMIRSMACSENENSNRYEELNIRKDFYDAIVSGYTEVLNGQLTFSEKKYIHLSGLLMIYMQALRFLTDYLNGDIYYRISYPEHNFDRATNQVILLKNLEEFLIHNYHFKF
ncbi:MAG: phosphotransferase [Chitinophagaceae bacterium]